MNEIWKDIPNYEGIYQVSNLGNFKSYDRIVFFGKIKTLRPGKKLKFRKNKHGYLYTVFSVNKVRKTIKVHRIVAQVFLENNDNKLCVNHINGIKDDNRVENLEWVTHSENIIHAWKIGLKKSIRGEKSHLSKLNNIQILEIKKIYNEQKISQKKIGELFNISASQIYRIVKNINWNI